MKQRTKYATMWNIKPAFILNWLNAKGQGGKPLTDGFMAYLQTKGATGATLSESMNQVLTAAGFTGTLQDKKNAFYISKTSILHPVDAELAFYNTPSLDFGASGIDVNTLLMLHLNNDAIDSSPVPFTITNNNVTFSNASPAFPGTFYGIYNGTNADLTVPNSANWAFGVSNYTIDFRINPIALPGSGSSTHLVWDVDSLSFTNGFRLYLLNNAGTQQIIYECTNASSQVTVATANTTLTTGTWWHVAVVVNGATTNIYVNGISVASGTSKPVGNSGTAMFIGSTNIPSSFMNADIQEFRISNIARWTSNFTPPSQPYS